MKREELTFSHMATYVGSMKMDKGSYAIFKNKTKDEVTEIIIGENKFHAVKSLTQKMEIDLWEIIGENELLTM